MSVKLGSVLVVYQGRALRWAVTSVVSWPCRAYQRWTMVMTSMPNGTVRSTAAGVRLRASPAPVMALASLKATSIGHY